MNRQMLPVLLSAVLLGHGSMAAAAPAPLAYEVRPYRYVSPAASELQPQRGVLASHVLRVEGAPWLRLALAGTVLGADSRLRMTSLRDGHQQTLDAKALRQWRNTSAYFNGDAVRIELLGDDPARAGHVEVRSLMVGLQQPVIPESQCGLADDRVASNEPDRARLIDVGCTANLVGDACFVTAGHCLSSAGYVNVVEFNVPPSNADRSINHPGPEDQYVPTESRDFTDGGQGNDWGVFTVSPNSETGLTPFEAQGSKLGFAGAIPSVGDLAEIVGYGVDDGADNQTQQYGAGPITVVSGTTLKYQADTEGGNSGSTVLVDGRVVAIHTHGGCGIAGQGANTGTLYTHPDLQAAYGEICGGGAPVTGPTCDDIRSVRARCLGGTISASAKLLSDGYDGQSLGFAIDGDDYQADISGSAARLRASGFDSGPHQVELVDPAGCRAPLEVDC